MKNRRFYTAASRMMAVMIALALVLGLSPITAKASSTEIPSGFSDVTGLWGNRTVTIKSVENGKYAMVDMDADGDPLLANSSTPDSWESFRTYLTSDGFVGFRNVESNKYLSVNAAQPDAPLSASANTLLAWESFRIYKSGANFYLNARVNGKWVSADVLKPNAPIGASSSTPESWESFILDDVSAPAGYTDVTSEWGGKVIALKSVQNGKYAMANLDVTGAPLQTVADNPYSWESFRTVLTSDGYIGFRNLGNNRYLNADAYRPSTPISAVSSSLLDWESFRIYKKGTNYYLRAKVNGSWVSADVGRPEAPVVVNAPSPSAWERFEIEER